MGGRRENGIEHRTRLNLSSGDTNRAAIRFRQHKSRERKRDSVARVTSTDWLGIDGLTAPEGRTTPSGARPYSPRWLVALPPLHGRRASAASSPADASGKVMPNSP